jgi:hypothetical protein
LNTAATASGYKFGVVLQMLDGNEAIAEQWKMEGAWIKEATYGDLDYSSADQVQIQLSIKYDHAWQELNNGVVGTDGINATAGFLL